MRLLEVLRDSLHKGLIQNQILNLFGEEKSPPMTSVQVNLVIKWNVLLIVFDFQRNGR